MILFLSELQKEHLSLLHRHSAQVLVDFCKLTLDYLNNGSNHKKNNIAAEKLDISVTCVQDLIHALAYLITEGCKHNLSESNFKSSLGIAGFSPEQQQVLVKLYNSKKSELSTALYQLQNKDPSYQDFLWRFEIQLASRNSQEEIRPMVTLNFIIATPKRVGQSEEDNNSIVSNKNDCMSPICVNSSIHDAKATSQCQNIINHMLLQCDLPNLLHLTNKLEEALKESKSQHVRKVQRSL
ncbi:COMM domain-containing protein 2 [Epargyreus clarus]|uniref:COMM domain-containing protein 2 n=1 Tax=Epargyreus clarus TaxID=520877 RepID=UPI003C2B7969